MKSLIDALLAKPNPQAGIPLPRPDPRDWTQRAVPQGTSEEGLGGAIHPDDLMRSMGVAPPAGRPIDQFNYEEHPQGVSPSQFPMGIPQPMESRGAGLFGVPAQHLQQMAGDVMPGPWQGANALPGAAGQTLNNAAAKVGGVGYSPKNIDFNLLDKLNAPPPPGSTG